MAAKRKAAGVEFSKRRGVVAGDWDGNSWDAVMVRAGSMEEVAERLVGSGLCGVVKRDVTREAIGGTLGQPAGKWAVVVKLRGQGWAQVVGLTYGDYEFPEELAKATKLEVMRLGYQDTAGATYFTYWAGGKRVMDFESCSLASAKETRFASDRHPKRWLKQFADEAAVRDALVGEVGAYVAMVWPTGPVKGKIELSAWDEEAIANVERVDLAVFGPAEALESGAAGEWLKTAIGGHDAGGVREALRAGAGVRFLPGTAASPLAYAMEVVSHAEMAASTEVVRVLLEAGADAKGMRGENPPIFACVVRVGLDAVDVIELIDLLAGHGADVNAVATAGLAKGQRVVHWAAMTGKLAVVKHLIERGADVTLTNEEGQTARAAVQANAAWRKEFFGKHAKGDAGEVKAMVEFLKRAEVGTADVGDVGRLAAKDRESEDARREKARAAFAELGEVFKAVGKVMEEGSAEAAAELAVVASPGEIHVNASKAKWADARGRDEAMKELEKRGYERVGDFGIAEMPAVRMRVLLHPGEHVFAVVSERGRVRWVDLVRYHKDGSAVTVTNAETSEAARKDVKGKKKVRMAGAGVDWLVVAMRQERVPTAGVEKVKAEEFGGRMERYYAEEMMARRRKRK